MYNHKLFIIAILFLVCSCNSNKVTDSKDYQVYLETNLDQSDLNTDLAFWSDKLEKTPNQYPYLAKRASVHTQIFNATGKIEHLAQAEQDLIAANKASSYKTSGYLKALAHNYVSQHKFKEALVELKKAEILGDKLNGTHKMLFDVHLELGNEKEAKRYLNEIKNFSDFDYLIRLSKWEDHNGNLDNAISYMERASKITETSNVSSLKQWSYTNLADFYGHAGKIDISYQYFLKALELNPNDAYAKKGIAWIIYSHEKNADEALRILNHVSEYYDAPDYYLLKSEIANFKGDSALDIKCIDTYRVQVENPLYGDMYNKYNILLDTENSSSTKQAIKTALLEVENRPTPQSYDLLAWSYFKNGDVKKAYDIVLNNIEGKTSEPEVLYHIAEVYKAAGDTEKIKPLKEELIGAIYELGPIMETKIRKL